MAGIPLTSLGRFESICIAMCSIFYYAYSADTWRNSLWYFKLSLPLQKASWYFLFALSLMRGTFQAICSLEAMLQITMLVFCKSWQTWFILWIGIQKLLSIPRATVLLWSVESLKANKSGLRGWQLFDVHEIVSCVEEVSECHPDILTRDEADFIYETDTNQ